MFISTAAFILAAVALAGVAGFLFLILALQRRWFGRFAHGLFLSIALAVAGTGIAAAVVVGEWGFDTARRSVDHEELRCFSFSACTQSSRCHKISVFLMSALTQRCCKSRVVACSTTNSMASSESRRARGTRERK